MENNTNYIDILIGSLRKKISAMERIMKMNLEQKEILSRETLDNEAFEENLKTKGDLIEELELLNSGFETLYKRVKEDLEGNKDQYREEIRTLQGLIETITDMNVQIQVEEQRNKKLAEQHFNTMRRKLKSLKAKGAAAQSYYSEMHYLKNVDSQFLDKKK